MTSTVKVGASKSPGFSGNFGGTMPQKRKTPPLREGDLVRIGGVPHDVVSGTRFGYVVVRNIETMAVKTARPGVCDLIATREERKP
ncbi:hypothetical protein QLT00_gp62 [Gordonia phage Commandaria]|uniref:Uncharacterized protein n=1 Tax=Gordonia phage Commandaria TaxID=3038364 RepID=A0AAF0K0Y9_9CAUD|nr:hypothetical protein QLT00_gp62 [Gordonia phage Commandaria]WGH20845.1 hypothetical protein [Gordonia phage Commandaria]